MGTSFQQKCPYDPHSLLAQCGNAPSRDVCFELTVSGHEKENMSGPGVCTENTHKSLQRVQISSKLER